MTTVRPARPDDAPDILRLLRLLAAFEGADGIAVTEDIIRRDGFGEGARFTALLAAAEGRVVGMVVLYAGYSSWRGAPTLVVHDLFVEEAARGSGAGRSLLAAAARLARDRSCCRMDVNVLARNAAGRRFYENLGFEPLNDWLIHRLDGAAFERLATEKGIGDEH